MKQKQAITKAISKRYKKAKKKEKSMILDEFVATTEYNRSYAARTLRSTPLKQKNKVCKRSRSRIYDKAVLKGLQKIWAVMDAPCGKRLAPMIPEMIKKLKQFKELELTKVTEEKLLNISAATIDRMLTKERKKMQLKGRCWTKPGTLLKHQIPIRTFADWNENHPGFVEIDLVGHDGGNNRGDFCQTLDVTDVCSGWTETRAIKNKAQKWVFDALGDIIATLPFPTKGIDSDNGSEFINHQLIRFCDAQKITFTRSRPYRKNDNCFVEQKNYSVVRKTVGYMRYDTDAELVLLNKLYSYLRLYTNFFQPSMKLIEKSRIGGKIKKRYDTPTTPYRRLLDLPGIDWKTRTELMDTYDLLNPADLKRKIIRCQGKLFKLSVNKSRELTLK